MGEVRDTIESPARGKSPIAKLREVEDQIGDLIEIKKRDLTTEGATMTERNTRAISLLESALQSIQQAKRSLEQY